MANATNRRDLIVKVVLDSLAKNIDISDNVYNTALDVYHQASRAGLVRGRSIEVVVSAALYASIRTHKSPQTLDDIAKNAEPRKKAIGRMYRLLVKELDIKTKPISSVDTVRKLGRELKIKDETLDDAIKLLHRADKIGLMSGRNPMSVVAAVIYHTSLKYDEKLTQRVISIATGVTEATIRNRNRELEEKLNLPKRPRHPADIRAARLKKERELKLKQAQESQ